MLLLFSLVALFIILHLNLPANALAGLDGHKTRYECNNLARESGQRDAAEDQAVRHASGPRRLFLVGRQQAVDGPHQSQRHWQVDRAVDQNQEPLAGEPMTDPRHLLQCCDHGDRRQYTARQREFQLSVMASTHKTCEATKAHRSRHDSDHLRTDKDDERIYQLTDRILALVERNVVPSLEILPEIAKGKKPCAVGLSLT
jgi:hypothetical protein